MITSLGIAHDSLQVIVSPDAINDIKTSANAIQIGPIGLFTGNYTLVYEHLYKSQHGLVIGGSIIDSKNLKGYDLSLNYRKHKGVGMKTGFWGIFINYSNVEGEVVESKNGQTENTYGFTNTAFAVGPNIGKRWVANSGLSLVFRIGYGIPFSEFKWVDEKPDDDIARFTEKIYKITSGLDGELSIGFCF